MFKCIHKIWNVHWLSYGTRCTKTYTVLRMKLDPMRPGGSGFMSVVCLGKAQCQNAEDSSRDAGGAVLTLLCILKLMYCVCLSLKLILRLVLECWCWKASLGFLGSIVSQLDSVKKNACHCHLI